jgi:type III restriction enzyme
MPAIPLPGQRAEIQTETLPARKLAGSALNRAPFAGRRSATRCQFITPIPKPKKHKAAAQTVLVFDEGKGLSTNEQQYDPTSIINEVRGYVHAWPQLSSSQWQVTPETARLLQHWRHHEFSGERPFFCQVEAAETAI